MDNSRNTKHCMFCKNEENLAPVRTHYVCTQCKEEISELYLEKK